MKYLIALSAQIIPFVPADQRSMNYARIRAEDNAPLTSLPALQYLCLLFYGAVLLLNVTKFRGGVFLVDNYMVFPVLVFLGASLSRVQRKNFRTVAKLGMLFAGWLAGISLLHHLTENSSGQFQNLLAPFLMGLPFAAFCEECVRKKAIHTVGRLFILVSLYFTACCLLLEFGLLPDFLQSLFFFGEKYMRLQAVWNPNIAAVILMIGLACWFIFGVGSVVKSPARMAVRYGVAGAIFYVLSLTNCRTVIIMTAAMTAAWLFLEICRKYPRRMLAGLLAAGVLLVGVFLLSTGIFKLHSHFLREAREAEGMSAFSEESTRSLANDLSTLTGRTEIWRGCIYALKNDPALLIWGTDDVGSALQKHSGVIAEHAHNSFLQAAMTLGLPGLLMSLVFSFFAVRNAGYLLIFSEDPLRRAVSLLCLAAMGCGMLEPLLFSTPYTTQFINFCFFLILGYLEQWYFEEAVSAEKSAKHGMRNIRVQKAEEPIAC